MKTVREAVGDYLALRRSLGFKLKKHQRFLEEFTSFLEHADLHATGAQLTRRLRSRLTVCCRIAPGAQNLISIPTNRLINYWKQLV